MQKSAILDKTRKYRYLLERQWGNDNNNFINFILLNPSTADETKDDPTIKACIKIAQNLGYDGLWVTNLFAFRATNPKELLTCVDPIGDNNDKYTLKYANKAKKIIIAWGNHGDILRRNKEVLKLLAGIKNIECFEITKTQNPKHPLYTKRDCKPILFK